MGPSTTSEAPATSEATTKRKTGKKQGNNEGNIRLRSDGRYEARLTLPDGKSKSLCGKTRAEVQKKLTAALKDVGEGLPLPSGKVTLGAYLQDWLKGAEGRVREGTAKRYVLDVRRVTEAPIGKLPLAQVTSQKVQAFLSDLHAKGLSPTSVGHCRAVLRAALN